MTGYCGEINILKVNLDIEGLNKEKVNLAD